MNPGGYTAEVTSLSSNATEKDVHDFFAFCGAIEHVEVVRWFLAIILICPSVYAFSFPVISLHETRYITLLTFEVCSLGKNL